MKRLGSPHLSLEVGDYLRMERWHAKVGVRIGRADGQELHGPEEIDLNIVEVDQAESLDVFAQAKMG